MFPQPTATSDVRPHNASGYTMGCRCDTCRDAHRVQNNELRKRRREEALDSAHVRASALSLIGLDLGEASMVVSRWSTARLRQVVLVLAGAVDPDMPLSQFGRDA